MIQTVGAGLTQKVIAKNNAARLYDMSLAKGIGIKEDIDFYQNDLIRYKSKVKEKNEQESKEAQEKLLQ
jgi:hypothetical protein